MDVEHDNQMQSFENEFDGRLAGMAFTRVGTFTAGATLTDMRQTLLWEVSQGGDGREYGWIGSFSPSGKVVAAGSSPTPVSAGNWVDRSQDTIRSELNIIFKTFSDVEAMVADASLVVGQIVETIGYYNGWAATVSKPKGGNRYEVVAAGTGTDDGGSLITLSNGLQAKALFLSGVDPFQFGAKGNWDWSSSTGDDDLSAWQSCIDYAPIDTEIKLSGKYVFGLSGQLNIYKRLTIDLAYSAFQALPSFSGSALVRVAKTSDTTPESYGALHTFEGVKLRHARILGAVPQYNFTTFTTDYGTTDHRTTTATGLEVTEIDGSHFEDITIRDFKGAGLLIGNKSAVRECTFDKINITHCGNASSSIGSLTIWSPISTAENGIHNHIYFNTLRVINSFHNSVRIECKPGTTPAYTFGAFIIHFNDAQFDNANKSGRAQAHMVEIAHAGYDILFNNCLWFNPYGSDSTVWGYSCLKLGYGSGSTDGVEQVILNKCRLQYGSVGNGINLRYCQQLNIDGVKFAGSVDGSIVAATITPTTARTTSVSEAAHATFVHENSCDFQTSNIYAHSTTSISNFSGEYYYGNEKAQYGLRYNKNKTISKLFSSTQATGTTDTITTYDLSSLSYGHAFKVNVEVLIAGVAVVGMLSGEFMSLGSNTVGGVATISNIKNATYANNFSLALETIETLTAGNFSSGNGWKFQIKVTNNTGSPVTIKTNILAM